jgi:hypothetical protein
METLGVWLRQRREAAGSTLEEVEAATRIKLRFLEMLEAGSFAALPGGELQARGFLRLYARYLEIPPDDVMARYDAEVHGAPLAAPPQAAALSEPADISPSAPTAASPPSQGYSVFRLDRRGGTLRTLMLAGAGIVALAVVAVVLYSALRGADGTLVSAADTATQVSQPAPTLEPVLTAEATELTPSALLPTIPAGAPGEITLALEATEHTWVRVTVDGQLVHQGMMSPDQGLSWLGQELILVETGNAAGLLVTINDQLLGRLGGRGQVRTRAWAPGCEVAVPAPATTPTS